MGCGLNPLTTFQIFYVMHNLVHPSSAFFTEYGEAFWLTMRLWTNPVSVLKTVIINITSIFNISRLKIVHV